MLAIFDNTHWYNILYVLEIVLVSAMDWSTIETGRQHPTAINQIIDTHKVRVFKCIQYHIVTGWRLKLNTILNLQQPGWWLHRLSCKLWWPVAFACIHVGAYGTPWQTEEKSYSREFVQFIHKTKTVVQCVGEIGKRSIVSSIKTISRRQ